MMKHERSDIIEVKLLINLFISIKIIYLQFNYTSYFNKII